jgi:hypothetical protein
MPKEDHVVTLIPSVILPPAMLNVLAEIQQPLLTCLVVINLALLILILLLVVPLILFASVRTTPLHSVAVSQIKIILSLLPLPMSKTDSNLVATVSTTNKIVDAVLVLVFLQLVLLMPTPLLALYAIARKIWMI